MNLSEKTISELKKLRDSKREAVLQNKDEQKLLQPHIGKLKNGMPDALTRKMKLEEEQKQLLHELREIQQAIYNYHREVSEAVNAS